MPAQDENQAPIGSPSNALELGPKKNCTLPGPMLLSVELIVILSQNNFRSLHQFLPSLWSIRLHVHQCACSHPQWAPSYDNGSQDADYEPS